MRTELELLKLLREEAECELSFYNGICLIVDCMNIKGKISLIEDFRLNGLLQQNWHLSKYPMGLYKFDTMQERLEFLDMLIKKYEVEEN